MHLAPSSTGRPEGGAREEARTCGAPPPPPPALFDGGPVLLQSERPPPEAAPPAEEEEEEEEEEEGGGGAAAAAAASGGEASSGPPEASDEDPQPLASGSNGTGANGWSECESTSAPPTGVSPPALPARTGSQQQHIRHFFPLEQVQKLEEIFQKQNYLGPSERRQVAAWVGLTELQVRNWFYNRRWKCKRAFEDQWQSLPPRTPLFPHGPRVPPSFSQDFSMYPRQIAPPFLPNSGLRSSSPGPLNQPPLRPPYPLHAPGLPYHFPTPHPIPHFADERSPSPPAE